MKRDLSNSDCDCEADRTCIMKATQENEKMTQFWDAFIRGREHELLHRNLEPEKDEELKKAVEGETL